MRTDRHVSVEVFVGGGQPVQVNKCDELVAVIDQLSK